ncbi:hypothetical protein [Actinomadura harenae]|uniref:Uncharacterized protein n=1 Tax=Actinomadura harenae TaxID=2483351 RepID=A0A3M2ME21_9ACTN|nr:hypothetical protein [Actinomadura harenae]RMI47812.1 hypothetical protein EBO15_00495 [Actinomadura harenae]
MTPHSPHPKWRREEFGGVPGSPEVSTWHVRPEPPLCITEADIYRDGGTGMMTVRDAVGRKWAFCFDKFLGRLCTGAHPSGDDAAFVRPGSPLEDDLFDLMEQTVEQYNRDRTAISARLGLAHLDRLPHFHRRALVHSGQTHSPAKGT